MTWKSKSSLSPTSLLDTDIERREQVTIGKQLVEKMKEMQRLRDGNEKVLAALQPRKPKPANPKTLNPKLKPFSLPQHLTRTSKC